MKNIQSLALALVAMTTLGSTASAAERKTTNLLGARGPVKIQASSGIQGASGLATGSINGNGANPVVERLSDDAWRTLFPIKQPATR